MTQGHLVAGEVDQAGKHLKVAQRAFTAEYLELTRQMLEGLAEEIGEAKSAETCKVMSSWVQISLADDDESLQ